MTYDSSHAIDSVSRFEHTPKTHGVLMDYDDLVADSTPAAYTEVESGARKRR